MNTSLYLNPTGILQLHPTEEDKSIDQTKIPWWLRLFAHFYVYTDDPAALKYISSKYNGQGD